jgi:alpha-1,3-rhamnosyl/mannosyltransferase
MRVVLNGLAALKPRTGVGHHVAELARELHSLHPGRVWVYPGERWPRPAARAGGRGSHESGLRSVVKGAAKAVGRAALGLHFNAVAGRRGFDLYHEPNFLPFPSHLPTVVTVHDLSAVRYPQWHPADRAAQHRRRLAASVRRAAHVITVSDAVRAEVLAEFGVPADRVTTVHNGVGPQFRPLPPADVAAVVARLDLPDRFFLCVGTVEPRKNLGVAMTAFADLPAAVRRDCPLVLAGPWGWRADAERELFERVAGPAGAVHLGYVADADLPALYNAAAGLVYPSWYEGFGMPPTEMLACGGAVLASTAAAVREVCGGHAESIDPADADGWRAAMLRLATDPGYRDRFRAGGPAQAARFTWQRAARETWAVYERAASSAAGTATTRR